MAKCWCGQDHSLRSQHGDARNGKIKHWVINWKLYEIRKTGQAPDTAKFSSS